ncbi:putative uncharacterized protein DDB_G0282133 isoform X2 [Cydia splendana]|uniref:putative uncharacterized protein DDB_G0282133 isoform X2 n=1 Tax=Cydia splendana TaxID=1100963 RepID=UPI00300D1D1B
MPKNYALSLSSSTYKNHIFEGFSRLQQNDEFVDMTLAAEGHWVKVHRTLVALASPYFRELLQSLPCQHPVMYLYGVSHEALGFILEYIYTGQVEIPPEKVQSFLHTVRDMQIAGLKNVVPPDENEAPRQLKQNKHVFLNTRQPFSAAGMYNTTNNENNTNFQLKVPSIVIPETRNEIEGNNKSLFFMKSTPMPLEGSNVFQDTRNMNVPSDTININLDEYAATSTDMNKKPQSNELKTIRNSNAPNKMINITMDESAVTNDDTNKDLRSNELLNVRNINAYNDMINLTLDEPEKSNNNINQKLKSNDFSNIRNIDTSGINMRLDESAAIYDNIDQAQISDEFQSISNINVPGQTINITLNECANNDNIDNVSQKPVAKIEILSSTVIKSKCSNAGVNLTGQGQLPEIYAQALANINNQNTSNHHETNTQNVKCASRSLMDISQLLDFKDDVSMDVDNQPDSLETPASSRNVEEMGYSSNMEENDEMGQQITDTDTLLYTVSNRGALQLILNRFIFCCHYQRDNGHKRRWRCIEYRDKRCGAAIDTIGEQVVARKHKHCHPNHEEKIGKKMARKDVKIFTTIQMAQDVMKQKSKTS